MRKRIYYLPGLISAIFLPVIFYHFSSKKIDQLNQRKVVLTISEPDPNLFSKNSFVYLKYEGHFPPLRNYTDVYLNDNDALNRKTLEFTELKIRQIVEAKDSINGIHFIFGDKCKYEFFIEVLNILTLECAKTYMPKDNSIWFYNFPDD